MWYSDLVLSLAIGANLLLDMMSLSIYRARLTVPGKQENQRYPLADTYDAISRTIRLDMQRYASLWIPYHVNDRPGCS